MHFFLTLYSGAGVVGGIQQLGSQALGHGLLTTLAGEFHNPAQRQGLTALGTDLDRHLVGGAAHTAGLYFQLGRHVVQRSLENFGGFLAGLFLHRLKSRIADVLRNTALAVFHNLIDELGDHRGPIDRIRQHLPLGDKSATGHVIPSLKDVR